MKKLLSIILSTLLLCSVFVGCDNNNKTASTNSNAVSSKQQKKGILVVSFGTSYQEALKSYIESSENEIENAYKDYEVRRAFTSDIIMKKLKERDKLEIDNPDAALQKMKKEEFTEVIVQPLHIGRRRV